jgi:hypothetical protein
VGVAAAGPAAAGGGIGCGGATNTGLCIGPGTGAANDGAGGANSGWPCALEDTAQQTREHTAMRASQGHMAKCSDGRPANGKAMSEAAPKIAESLYRRPGVRSRWSARTQCRQHCWRRAIAAMVRK